jgi:ribA/ribD-fused uncharacterized protein
MSKDAPWEYEDDNVVLFWGGILSNWYRSDMTVDGIVYNSVEQHMMVAKAREFNDPASELLIMAAAHPRQQKNLGRKVKNFDPQVWKDCCLERCLPGISAKFQQNASLAGLLLSTQDKKIAEASPYDVIWGIGLSPENIRARDPKQWQGTNYLGELLMIVRDELRETT